jgi:hypothetical protein
LVEGGIIDIVLTLSGNIDGCVDDLHDVVDVGIHIKSYVTFEPGDVYSRPKVFLDGNIVAVNEVLGLII